MPRHRGRIAVGTVVAINTVAWLAAPPVDDGRSEFARQALAEYLASTTALLFGLALVLASRARFLERVFGGLDRMYTAHRQAALTGFVLLLAHVTLIPWRLDFRGGATPSGIIAFTGIAILVVLAAAPRLRILRRVITISYQRWRWTHHLVGVFFVFSFAHSLLADAVVRSAPFGSVLLWSGYVVGILAYLYSLSLARLLRPRRRYRVQGVRPLDPSTVTVTLESDGRRRVRHRSGQFAIVSFHQRRLREPHPFTISSAPGDALLSLTIKASGDYTARLARELRVGTRAVVEGGYGAFDYRTGAQQQVWVAGGIGVTPFLSWLRDQPSVRATAVDLFYVVTARQDAVCWEELRTLQPHHPEIAIHLHVSEESGRFAVERIASNIGDYAERDYFLCGPRGLIQSLQRQLRAGGVPDRSIHYEEFSFR